MPCRLKEVALSLALGALAVSCGGAEPEVEHPIGPAPEPKAVEKKAAEKKKDQIPASLLKTAKAIETRGKQIASYQAAVIEAAVLLKNSGMGQKGFDTYVALPSRRGWEIYFGTLAPQGASFDIAHAFFCSISGCAELTPGPDTPDLAPFARAIAKASDTFVPKAEAYNTAVFTERNGSISVYLTPGSDDPDVALLGGDYRISLAADGEEVLKVIELHDRVIRFPREVPPGIAANGTMRTLDRGDLPTGTDVAFIMQNPHLAPHLVVGPNWATQISERGDVVVLGDSREVMDEEPAPIPPR